MRRRARAGENAIASDYGTGHTCNSHCTSGWPANRITKPITRPRCRHRTDAYTCSRRFCPKPCLQYEHMFSSHDTPQLARRLAGALRLIRSFLLLEDDYGRDWEAGHMEQTEGLAHCARRAPPEEISCGAHPHRVALRSRVGARRQGAGAPREQVCLCPVSPRRDRGRRDATRNGDLLRELEVLREGDLQRDSRITTGIERVAIDR
jgi:hypothetical protein